MFAVSLRNLHRFFLGSCSFFYIGCQFTLPRVQRVQPTLSAGGKSSPISQFYYLRFGELGVQISPKCIVCQIRVPEYCIGIT